LSARAFPQSGCSRIPLLFLRVMSAGPLTAIHL